MFKKILTIIIIISLIVVLLYSGILDIDRDSENKKPIVDIIYPLQGATVSKIVTITGTASDPAFRRIDVDVNTGKVQGLF